MLSLVYASTCFIALIICVYANHDTRKRQKAYQEKELQHTIEMGNLMIRLLDKSIETLEIDIKLLRSELENLRLEIKLLASEFKMLALIDEIHHLRQRPCVCDRQLSPSQHVIIDQDGNVLS